MVKKNLQRILALAAVFWMNPQTGVTDNPNPAEPSRPNILFAIADDWGWPHAGSYGDTVVQTPTFDRLAREGVVFHHAYVSSPSCTPSRGALLTGQWHWRLEEAANLWSVFPDHFMTFPELLANSGYEVGYTGKGWGPGKTETPDRSLIGKKHDSLERFLYQRAPDRPFFFWLGSGDPHRPYEEGTGAQSGLNIEEIRLPACFPDHPIVRSDVADYYWEVNRFDRLVGEAVSVLEKTGELDRTLICMTSDHGMPFPRCKSNLYDTGARVPLAIRWPGVARQGREIEEFVSLTDLAPTFLKAAKAEVPDEMTGNSILDLLGSTDSGHINSSRDYVLIGKERHVPGQEAQDLGGYPCRAIRTYDFLYIRNFRPDRWPAGTPHFEKAAVPGNWLADCDNGPTKTFMVENRRLDDHHNRLYDLAFGKRPDEELYDLGKDPEQLENRAGDPELYDIKRDLQERLFAKLRETGDPRVRGTGGQFDRYPYLGGGPKHPNWGKKDP